jgi:hypothetical protein
MNGAPRGTEKQDIFSLLSATSHRLVIWGLSEQATTLRMRVFRSKTYQEAIELITEYERMVPRDSPPRMKETQNR